MKNPESYTTRCREVERAARALGPSFSPAASLDLPVLKANLQNLNIPFASTGGQAITVDIPGSMDTGERGYVYLSSPAQFAVGLGLTLLLSELSQSAAVGITLVFAEDTVVAPTREMASKIAMVLTLSEDGALARGQVGVNFGILTPASVRLKVIVASQDVSPERVSRSDISASAQIILYLREALSRRVDPLKPFTLSFEQVSSYADHVAVSGVFENIARMTQTELHDLLMNSVTNLTAGHGVQCRLSLSPEADLRQVDPHLAEHLLEATSRLFGKSAVRLEFPGGYPRCLGAWASDVPLAGFHIGINDSTGAGREASHHDAQFLLRCAETLALFLLTSPDVIPNPLAAPGI